MCTAITYKTKDHYFGRNLDLEFSYNETVTVTPRNFPFVFRKVRSMEKHYAIIGMAYVVNDYPLYYDATNEKGLSMAGLNFPENANYKEEVEGQDNISPFEFIPWVLGQCSDIPEVRVLLSKINLVNINFSDELPLSPLHWIIADRNASITVEAVKDGIKVYDNPVGVLTNNPTFDMQMFNLNNYIHMSNREPVNSFSTKVIQGFELKVYSRGMGAMGMPGDLSSASRFVRAVFTKLNSVSGESESESISQFFHVLGSVAQQRGCVYMGDDEMDNDEMHNDEMDNGEMHNGEMDNRNGDDKYEITIYSSCCNTDKGIYYYTTYENSQVTGVDIYKENLEGCCLITYPLIKGQQIKMQNVE